ncbi:MAG: DUF2284 domain-containing protein [Lachnospiraceae bacterium]|nr:DUF2284 domain-containing protein [Lachnospiraceae bacterium]
MLEQLRQKALSLGAFRAEIVEVKDITLDASFRKLCESNACGNYGRNYMCPPDAGDIYELMDQIRIYDKALIYQTVRGLEDSYDFEGMMQAGSLHNQLAQKLWDYTDELQSEDFCGKKILHLGAGGCRLCSVCGKVTGAACAHPDRAMRSLETCGINVSLLAQLAGMCYINGLDTVTYFGAVFVGSK